MPKTKRTGQALGRLNNQIRRNLALFPLPGNFSAAQERTLNFILTQDSERELFQKDIEEEFGLRPSSATALLKGLEKEGLIQRTPTDYDARLKKIIPTEKTLAYKALVIEHMQAFEARLAAGISEEELDTFNALVEKMIHNLE